ncbi:serine/threonine-protein phosphatase 2A regulatory subunit B'' subunit beta-like [Clytia hemisphaerica]|uniref:EF-hand domain-containing protein n=1 Tax=Clytia hemisphaerica TaxID=252671 RepID=A0A7M5V1Y3_9CNID
MGPTMIPLLKEKVDELFLHWFSEVETQQNLRKELSNILGTHDEIVPISTPFLTPSPHGGQTTLISRPSSPPIPPGSPTTPRSPRRRTGSDLSRKGSRKNPRRRTQEEQKPALYPGCAEKLKPFYFPFGEPRTLENEGNTVNSITTYFDRLKNQTATMDDFPQLMKICGAPLYWKYPYFLACGGNKSNTITCKKFIATWKHVNTKYHDEASRFFHLLSKDSQKHLTYDDFEGLLQDIINTHPGLKFLLDAPEFHSRYIITVVARIFYTINRSWNGKLSLTELRRSNFLTVLKTLEEEEDINQVVDFFSYEHFYVIYCKFWELDTDHDMVISKDDLSRYSNGAVSLRMIDRLFSGCVTRDQSLKEGKMLYVDFIWFILSEVDKASPTGMEYWFRCMDMDGDGVISMYELQYFYEDQLQKMIELGMETLSFQDCLCQMLDLVKPSHPYQVTLRDLKKCKLAPVFFDTFFNLEKWLEHEQKDPFQASRNENGEPEVSAWERYVGEEYELLVAEEGASQINQEIDYEDDFDDEEMLTYEESLAKHSSLDPSLSNGWSALNAVS